MINENFKKTLKSLNKYYKLEATGEVYSVFKNITDDSYDQVLNHFKNEKENKSSPNQKKAERLFKILDTLDKKTFLDKTSNNPLSNFVRFKNIETSIRFMRDNIFSKDPLKSPIIKKTNMPNERYELTDLSSGNYLSYDMDNDFLYVNTKGKFVILEGREAELKTLLKEEIIIPLEIIKKEQKEELEVKQMQMYLEIKKKLGSDNYTPDSYFDDMMSWEDKDFITFIDKFDNNEIKDFKKILTNNIKYFEDLSMSGNKMNEAFDNIGSRHRRVLERINHLKPEIAQQNKKKTQKPS